MTGEETGSAPPVAKPAKGPGTRYNRLRLAVLTGAFLLIAVNPFLNYYLHIDFIQGWYQSLGIGKLWFVSPLEGLESLLITKSPYLPSLVGMLIPVLIAFFLGRVFCSWICPISFLLELFDRARRFISAKPFLRNRLIVAKKLLWFVLIAELVVSLVLGAPLFVFLSPLRTGRPGNHDGGIFRQAGPGGGACHRGHPARAAHPPVFLPDLLSAWRPPGVSGA